MSVRDANDPGTMDFDFGDPVLNDPDYESKVGGDAVQPSDTANTPADTVSTPDAQADTAGQPPAAEQRGTDTGAGGAAPEAGAGRQPAAPALKADDKGNLVDAKGNIVATAGAERRYYERVQQQSKHIRNLERDLEQARAASTMHGVLNDVPQKLGLDARETELGLQVVASFKKDPVATARWALQETMRMGYNLAQIVGADAQGQPLSGSMDLSAVKAMINEAVAPLVGDRQASAREQQIAADAERDYQAFIAKHENANVHEDTLAAMLANDTALTPETAYWQLVAYAARNQLDFTRPLREQVLARQQGSAQPQHQHGNAQPSSAQQPMPMPNGSSMAPNVQQENGLAAPDESWDNIVQQSLREAGFTH